MCIRDRITPGLIDAHSHLGVYAAPSANANDDGNEATAPTTAAARAGFGYWPGDPQIARALAGGVTTALILPGSANLIGGRGFTVAFRPARTADDGQRLGGGAAGGERQRGQDQRGPHGALRSIAAWPSSKSAGRSPKARSYAISPATITSSALA